MNPTILVPAGTFGFYVDDANNLASDTYTLGPPMVFRGRLASRVRREAKASPDRIAAAVPDRLVKKDRDFLLKLIPEMLARHYYVPVKLEDVTEDRRFVDLYSSSVGKNRIRLNRIYWEAMMAWSDEILIAKDTQYAPAVFLYRGTVVGLVMPVRLAGAR